MPIPPAADAITNPTRSTSGSTPMRGPRPAQTPASTAPERLRRSGGDCVSGTVTGRMFSLATTRTGEPAGEEDAAERAEHGRQHVGDAQLDHVGLVEQQESAERDQDDARDERGRIEAGARGHAASHAARLVPVSRSMSSKRSGPPHSNSWRARKRSPTRTAPM